MKTSELTEIIRDIVFPLAFFITMFVGFALFFYFFSGPPLPK